MVLVYASRGGKAGQAGHGGQLQAADSAVMVVFVEQTDVPAHWPFREHSETMEGGAGKRSKNQRARTGTNSLQAHTRPDETLEVADEGGQVGRSIELVFGDG